MHEVSADNSRLRDRERSGQPRVRWWWLAFVGIAGLVLLAGVLAVPFTSTIRRMDPVTGATAEQRNVMFGGGVYRKKEPTALSRWLAEHDPVYRPSWVSVSVRRRNVFGGLVSFYDDPPPAVAALNASPPGWASPLEVFVGSASEGRIREFVAIMRRGGEAERFAAVKAVGAQPRSPR